MISPVVTIGPGATVFEALMLLRSGGASGLTVVGPSGTVAGVISERDVAKVMLGGSGFPQVRGILGMLMSGFEHQPLESLKDLREKLESTLVGEVMSAPPFVIGPEDRVDAAAEIMQKQEINRLPVVKDGCLVGIITRRDLLRAMVRPAPG
jgi:CBS domain-containing protein